MYIYVHLTTSGPDKEFRYILGHLCGGGGGDRRLINLAARYKHLGGWHLEHKGYA